jgi:hypothetical protein
MRQFCRAIELDEPDGGFEYEEAVAAALFPLGTSFYEVEGVPVSVNPDATNARAWDIPGAPGAPGRPDPR